MKRANKQFREKTKNKALRLQSDSIQNVKVKGLANRVKKTDFSKKNEVEKLRNWVIKVYSSIQSTTSEYNVFMNRLDKLFDAFIKDAE